MGGPEQRMSKPDWQDFEVAVANFCAALDPSARVSHNVKTPDRDTGTPRQRDVWIEGRLCDLFPVKALVSCKRYKRKVNQQDMDAFLGELRSSQAQVGVLYSYSGFSKNAIAKGKAANVSCCRLYTDQPPDLPELISIASYFWRSQIELQLSEPPSPNWRVETWEELFSVQNGESTVLDKVNEHYRRCHERALVEVQELGEWRFRTDHALATSFSISNPESQFRFDITIIHRWRVFRAKLEAHLVNGSYSYTESKFSGRISVPPIDTWQSHPGEGWDELPVATGSLLDPAVHAFAHCPDARQELQTWLGPQALPGTR